MNKFREILFLKSIKGIGKNAIYTKYWNDLKTSDGIGDLIKKIEEKETKLSESDIREAAWKAEKLSSEIENDSNITVITVMDDEYPTKLNVMGNKRPLVLYIKGNAEALNMDNIAVVGTREPSEWSMKVEANLVRKILDLSDRAIVSGLALGCDRIAHETAVNEKKVTIAVMPCGVNIITPASHKQLALDIISTGGCLVSEYEPNVKAFKTYFVERDAIVAALTDVTLVVECGIKSGTMHTVEAAHEYGRPIACYFPKDMSKGAYAGNEYMVKEKRAVKVSNTEDLIRLLATKEIIVAEKNEEGETKQYTIEDYTNILGGSEMGGQGQ